MSKKGSCSPGKSAVFSEAHHESIFGPNHVSGAVHSRDIVPSMELGLLHSLLHWKLWDESLCLGDPVPTLKCVLRTYIMVLQLQAWLAHSLWLFLPLWLGRQDSHGSCIYLGFVFPWKEGSSELYILKSRRPLSLREAQCANSWLHQRTPALGASLSSKCLSWAEKLFRQQGCAF